MEPLIHGPEEGELEIQLIVKAPPHESGQRRPLAFWSVPGRVAQSLRQRGNGLPVQLIQSTNQVRGRLGRRHRQHDIGEGSLIRWRPVVARQDMGKDARSLEVISEGLAQHIKPMGVRWGSPAECVQDRPKILGLRPLPQDLGGAADFQPVVRFQPSANDGQRFRIHRHSAGLRVILMGQDAPLGDQPEGMDPDQGIPRIG